MYIHELNTEWPALIELINMDKRLVVFWEQSGDASHPYFHDFRPLDGPQIMPMIAPHRWIATHCEGDDSQPVYHMNNWLKNQAGLSDPTRSTEANDVDFMVERAEECIRDHGKRPTFIAVDWWEDGDVESKLLGW